MSKDNLLNNSAINRTNKHRPSSKQLDEEQEQPFFNQTHPQNRYKKQEKPSKFKQKQSKQKQKQNSFKNIFLPSQKQLKYEITQNIKPPQLAKQQQNSPNSPNSYQFSRKNNKQSFKRPSSQNILLKRKIYQQNFIQPKDQQSQDSFIKKHPLVQSKQYDHRSSKNYQHQHQHSNQKIYDDNDYEFGHGLEKITQRNHYKQNKMDTTKHHQNNQNSLAINNKKPNFKKQQIIQPVKYQDSFQSFSTPLYKTPQHEQQKQQQLQKRQEKQTLKLQSSTFSPLPSNVSINKKRISKRISQLQKRQSSKNFFKMPLTSSSTQDHFNKNSGTNFKSFGKKKQPITLTHINHKHNSNQFIDTNKLSSQMPNSQHNPSINKMKQSKHGDHNHNQQSVSNKYNNFGMKSSSHSKKGFNIKNNKTQATYSPNNTHISISPLGGYSRISSMHRQQLHLSIANDLQRLLFKYNGGHANTLYNYRLKIKNESNVKIQLKVKCTSPAHYIVRPFTFTHLQPQEIVNLTIELKLYPHDLNPSTMKHDLSRYKNDKFKITYTAFQIHPDIQYEPGQKTLSVVIQQTQQQKLRNQGIIKNLKNQQQKMVSQTKQLLIYKKLIQKNQQKIEQIRQKIKVLQNKQYRTKYFTKGVFWTAFVFGSLLGFWIL